MNYVQNVIELKKFAFLWRNHRIDKRIFIYIKFWIDIYT